MQAERPSQFQVGAACMLTAITTSVSFLALTISDVSILRNFGWTGAIGILLSGMIVLVVHAFLALLIGRFWKAKRAGAVPDLFRPLAEPCAAICRFAVSHARSISLLIAALFVGLAFAYANFPADYSVREHLPQSDPANAALGRIDQHFDGAFPIQIIVPMDGVAALAGGPRKDQGRPRSGREDSRRRIASLAVEPGDVARRGERTRKPRRGSRPISTSSRRPHDRASSAGTEPRRWFQRASRRCPPTSPCR